jgi:hypothetical protein
MGVFRWGGVRGETCKVRTALVSKCTSGRKKKYTNVEMTRHIKTSTKNNPKKNLLTKTGDIKIKIVAMQLSCSGRFVLKRVR